MNSLQQSKYFAGAIIISLIISIFFLWLVDAPLVETAKLLVEGAFGTNQRIGDTSMIWVPLLLASASLVVTFSAGLWNIGVEGQIVAGAVAATFIAREVEGSAVVVLALMVIGGFVGGALWGLLVGVLRVKGGVNEIFGGIGLNFVATGLIVYLVIGPWSREGVASTGGTEPFRAEAWFPTIDGLRASPLALVIAFLALASVMFLLSRTNFGLRLRATGKNSLAANRFGIATSRYLLMAFIIGGGIAGLAGVTQAGAVYHRLVPSISGGYGFLAILIVLLARFRGLWVIPIALFFATIAMGSFQWQLRLGLHSALGGVIQGVLVLSVVLVMGYREVRQLRQQSIIRNDTTS